MKILVACDHVVLTGGLLRFDRVAAAIGRDGHELRFVAMGLSPAARHTDIPVLTPIEAAALQWDCVMVPGAGFPLETIASFSIFRTPNFGLRVQHILNDQTRRQAFLDVNLAFDPQVVIFNNEHWPVGTFTEFKADRFHVLLGAVDTTRFCLREAQGSPDGPWIVGGLANKNPVPLVEAIEGMSNVVVVLFGNDHYGLAQRYPDLIAEKKVRLLGPVDESDLPEFYRGLDCVAATETFAGWSNLAAEAMASCIPVVCTPAGTTAFARDGETALVVVEPTPEALRVQLERLRADTQLCQRLARNARKRIEEFDWQSYSRTLLELCHQNGAHYFHEPRMGLFGKWPVEDRLLGLQPLIQYARESTVLELGAAEGLIARTFLDAGVSLLHGFEINADRVKQARRLTADWAGKVVFAIGDLSDWQRFRSEQPLLQSSYDIVLFLGLHHHLPSAARNGTLRGAALLARRHFAYRAPEATRIAEGVDEILESLGFRLTSASDGTSTLGDCRIYERVSQ